MAKKDLGRLAGLAALAGAAYMASKDKDEKTAPKGKEDTGAGYKSTETRLESPEDTIKRSSAKAPGDNKPIIADMPEEAAPAAPKTDKVSRAPAAAKTDPTRRALEAGMSRGTRTVRNDNYSNEGRSYAKPPSTMSSSAEGMKNYKPRVTPPAAPFKGGQPGYDEAGNFLGGRRGYDEAGNPMKKGGKVKKMASGGMTASKRADGIASRGKTKCKMY